MSATSRSVEEIYRERVEALSPADRVARMAAVTAWVRNQMRRSLLAADPDLSSEQIKWKVASKLYGQDTELGALIRKRAADVSA